MDTILPDETRPPTLAQYENLTESAGILTDRFGFIYDQKRRVRQGTKASSRSDHRIETLANHRKTQSIAASDDDAASISSQLSLERAVSPPPNTKLADPNAKRWQDYLKLSSLPGGELLSHTPAAAPITDIVTGAGPGDTPKKSLPKLSISHKGLDLNMVGTITLLQEVKLTSALEDGPFSVKRRLGERAVRNRSPSTGNFNDDGK